MNIEVYLISDANIPLAPMSCFDASGLFAASSRSAWLPCLSPFESFLKAYCTEMILFPKNWPKISLSLLTLHCSQGVIR